MFPPVNNITGAALTGTVTLVFPLQVVPLSDTATDTLMLVAPELEVAVMIFGLAPVTYVPLVTVQV